MLKKQIIFTILCFLLLMNCSIDSLYLNLLELEGEWVIMSIKHEGNKIYPNYPRGGLRVAGYENYSSLNFSENQETVALPGFNSEDLKLKYKLQSDSISFYLDSVVFDAYKIKRHAYYPEDSINQISNEAEKEAFILERSGLQTRQYEESLTIYCQGFEIGFGKSENHVFLTSKNTTISLVKQSYLFNQRINNLIR